MKNAGQRIATLLVVLGVIFGLLGIRSIWRDYAYRKASIIAKAEVLSVEIKDIRSKHGNYYIRPTHHISQQLTFLRDGKPDTLTLESEFLMYTEGKITKNPNPVPTAEQLMKQEKHVRFVPESKKNETAFPERIDINDNGEYEAKYRLSFFFNMLFCFLAGGMIRLLLRK